MALSGNLAEIFEEISEARYKKARAILSGDYDEDDEVDDDDQVVDDNHTIE